MEPTRSKVRCALSCSSTVRGSPRDAGCKTCALPISLQRFPRYSIFLLHETQPVACCAMFLPLCIDTVAGFRIVSSRSNSPAGAEKLWLQATQKRSKGGAGELQG